MLYYHLMTGSIINCHEEAAELVSDRRAEDGNRLGGLADQGAGGRFKTAANP